MTEHDRDEDVPAVRPAQRGEIAGFDHVALPMQNIAAMIEFYGALGLPVADNPQVASVYVGEQMINFHHPSLWQRDEFTLRAPSARPPCGDVCFVWEGSTDSLHALLADVGIEIIEGPAERQGARRKSATSVYARDPDGNLLEFLTYPTTDRPELPKGFD